MSDDLVEIDKVPAEGFDGHLPGAKTISAVEVMRLHRTLQTPLWPFLRDSRVIVALTAPLIYACLLPFLMLDLFVTIYQKLSFPIYRIPIVQRNDYLKFDRGRLRYLNLIERMNCRYCSYANGLIAYVKEIGARTEQHWCPIKHATQVRNAHSRYAKFLPYGDGEQYKARAEAVRQDFEDLQP